MKIIETKGIIYLETFDGCTEWYWGTDYSCGDLYEAEEVYLAGERFEPNRLIFVHYPDGEVFEPIKTKEYQYFGNPAYIDGNIYILSVNFEEQLIHIFQYLHEKNEVSTVIDISLSEVKDCYNLAIDGSPMMLTRQGGDDYFQVIWPEKVKFKIADHESFYYRENEKLFFSVWSEETVYQEDIYIREYPSGKLIEKISGGIMTMPDKQRWVLR